MIGVSSQGCICSAKYVHILNFSESSEEETDVQPEKRARREVKGAGKTAAEFDTGFEFFGDGVGGGKDGYLNDQVWPLCNSIFPLITH